MTLPIIPVTYDGIALFDFDLGICLELVVGLVETPSVRGTDTTIPAAPGSLAGDRVNDVLALELRGDVFSGIAETTGDDMRASHWTNLRTLRTLFRPDRDRAPLVATLPDGTILTIQARPKNIVSQETIPGERSEVSIALDGDDDWIAS